MKEYFLWLAKFVTMMFLFLVAIPLIFGGIAAINTNNLADKSGVNANRVAVVELNGVIEDSKDILEELYKRASDKSISSIVLRINSPGGVVGPSQDIYDAVKTLKAKKPIVASMGSVAASGGFYAALGASKIYCQPGTLTGSIGVIMQLPNFAKVTEKLGVSMTTIKSGKFKDVGNSFRDMTPEEQEFAQGTVNEIYESFLKAVLESRSVPEAQVREVADGRVILGSQAVKLGLADGFGNVYESALESLKLAGVKIDPNTSPVLVYKDQEGLGKFKKFLEAIIDLPIYLKSQMYGSPSAHFMMQ